MICRYVQPKPKPSYSIPAFKSIATPSPPPPAPMTVETSPPPPSLSTSPLPAIRIPPLASTASSHPFTIANLCSQSWSSPSAPVPPWFQVPYSLPSFFSIASFSFFFVFRLKRTVFAFLWMVRLMTVCMLRDLFYFPRGINLSMICIVCLLVDIYHLAETHYVF